MPRPFSRSLSTEHLSQADELLVSAEEAGAWTQLHICEDTTLAGFFRPQLMLLASRARTTIPVVAGTLAKLNEAEIITLDRGWIFIPGYFELQVGTKVPNWRKIVSNTASRFEGEPTNRAFGAFTSYDPFVREGVFSFREQGGPSGPPADPPDPPKTPARTAPDGDPDDRRKPRPPQQTIIRPPFEEFLNVVRSTKSGAGRKHPRPMEKAEALYHWFDNSKIGWTEEWPRLAAGFVIKDLTKDLGSNDADEAEEDTGGRALPGGGRLAI